MSSYGVKTFLITAFVRLALSQTPTDFLPSTQQQLGVSFPKIEVTPPGTEVQTLDRTSDHSDYYKEFLKLSSRVYSSAY
jgi:hypothetical protein